MGNLTDGFEELEATRVRISKVFIPNCVSCWRSWLDYQRKKEVK
jgi:hypothetical protein